MLRAPTKRVQVQAKNEDKWQIAEGVGVSPGNDYSDGDSGEIEEGLTPEEAEMETEARNATRREGNKL